MKQRVLWIDWIKIIGIYLIVLGHMSAPGNDFIYVFHVPLFFITSGYLAQKADSMKVCVSKIYALNNTINCLVDTCIGKSQRC